ncbi:hypothetical protein [Haloferula sp. BvORR071]|uniref:hypothetical protein n=1 Tax=Haloferula sp. BvORR071 TaxID=1396141 RepID=UPI00054F286A|nr:hypothetical protein [Haloferula sp. BvORR071]
MSYDLYFWREKRPFHGDAGQRVDELSREQPDPEVESFAKEDVIARFEKEFPEIERNFGQLIWRGLDSGFEVNFCHADERRIHLIVVTCGYKLLDHTEILNRIIDVAHDFGCGFYDPQVPQRYPEPDRVEQ